MAPGPWLAQSVPKPAGVHFGVCRVFLRDSVGICGGRATNRCEVASSSGVLRLDWSAVDWASGS